MNIVAADWLPYCLPLKRPWQTSRGSIGERRGKLYRLQTADGLTGWGDCAPLPEFGIDEAAHLRVPPLRPAADGPAVAGA